MRNVYSSQNIASSYIHHTSIYASIKTHKYLMICCCTPRLTARCPEFIRRNQINPERNNKFNSNSSAVLVVFFWDCGAWWLLLYAFCPTPTHALPNQWPVNASWNPREVERIFGGDSVGIIALSRVMYFFNTCDALRVCAKNNTTARGSCLFVFESSQFCKCFNIHFTIGYRYFFEHLNVCWLIVNTKSMDAIRCAVRMAHDHHHTFFKT